jgi:FkbM family methyltransferase
VVTLERVDNDHRAPALGQECRFAARAAARLAVIYYLEHEGVFYPHPLSSESDQSVRLYLEAPGRYVLHAAWRSPAGDGGWARCEFRVAGAAGSTPQQCRVDDERLWVPTPWDAEIISAHEQPVLRELQRIIRYGSTVYDVGANVGLFSLRFARWTGAEGWVYAIEPNPVCICFLRANLEQLRVRNFAILPVALSDRSGPATYSLNYGSSLIGLVTQPTTRDKPGHHIAVETADLDSLIAQFALRRPDFVKIDVEGAEETVVAGMIDTLARCRPGLMIELHGRHAAEGTLKRLGPLGYEYLLCSTRVRYSSADELLAAIPDATVQVIAYA